MRKYIKRKYIPITKYNPLYRDENGSYNKEDWTSYSEIGKKFNGKILTLEYYLKIENKYIEAFFKMTAFFKTKKIKISYLNKHQIIDQIKEHNDEDLIQTFSSLNLKSTISIKDKQLIIEIIKLVLREYIEIELLIHSESRSEVIFGFDFYMYLKTNLNVNSMLKDINKNGLFAER